MVVSKPAQVPTVSLGLTCSRYLVVSGSERSRQFSRRSTRRDSSTGESQAPVWRSRDNVPSITPGYGRAHGNIASFRFGINRTPESVITYLWHRRRFTSYRLQPAPSCMTFLDF